MNQTDTVKEYNNEVRMVEERKVPKEKVMSFKSMLEQFYKKNFESIAEPEQAPAQPSFLATS